MAQWLLVLCLLVHRAIASTSTSQINKPASAPMAAFWKEAAGQLPFPICALFSLGDFPKSELTVTVQDQLKTKIANWYAMKGTKIEIITAWRGVSNFGPTLRMLTKDSALNTPQFAAAFSDTLRDYGQMLRADQVEFGDTFVSESANSSSNDNTLPLVYMRMSRAYSKEEMLAEFDLLTTGIDKCKGKKLRVLSARHKVIVSYGQMLYHSKLIPEAQVFSKIKSSLTLVFSAIINEKYTKVISDNLSKVIPLYSVAFPEEENPVEPKVIQIEVKPNPPKLSVKEFVEKVKSNSLVFQQKTEADILEQRSIDLIRSIDPNISQEKLLEYFKRLIEEEVSSFRTYLLTLDSMETSEQLKRIEMWGTERFLSKNITSANRSASNIYSFRKLEWLPTGIGSTVQPTYCSRSNNSRDIYDELQNYLLSCFKRTELNLKNNDPAMLAYLGTMAVYTYTDLVRQLLVSGCVSVDEALVSKMALDEFWSSNGMDRVAMNLDKKQITNSIASGIMNVMDAQHTLNIQLDGKPTYPQLVLEPVVLAAPVVIPVAPPKVKKPKKKGLRLTELKQVPVAVFDDFSCVLEALVRKYYGSSPAAVTSGSSTSNTNSSNTSNSSAFSADITTTTTTSAPIPTSLETTCSNSLVEEEPKHSLLSLNTYEQLRLQMYKFVLSIISGRVSQVHEKRVMRPAEVACTQVAFYRRLESILTPADAAQYGKDAKVNGGKIKIAKFVMSWAESFVDALNNKLPLMELKVEETGLLGYVKGQSLRMQGTGKLLDLSKKPSPEQKKAFVELCEYYLNTVKQLGKKELLDLRRYEEQYLSPVKALVKRFS